MYPCGKPDARAEADASANRRDHTVSATAAGAGQNLSKVEGPDVAELLDLLAATEAVGNDDGGGAGGLNGGSRSWLAMVCETSNLSASKPKGPAMPQQPA